MEANRSWPSDNELKVIDVEGLLTVSLLVVSRDFPRERRACGRFCQLTLRSPDRNVLLRWSLMLNSSKNKEIQTLWKVLTETYILLDLP